MNHNGLKVVQILAATSIIITSLAMGLNVWGSLGMIIVLWLIIGD